MRSKFTLHLIPLPAPSASHQVAAAILSLAASVALTALLPITLWALLHAFAAVRAVERRVLKTASRPASDGAEAAAAYSTGSAAVVSGAVHTPLPAASPASAGSSLAFSSLLSNCEQRHHERLGNGACQAAAAATGGSSAAHKDSRAEIVGEGHGLNLTDHFNRIDLPALLQRAKQQRLLRAAGGGGSEASPATSYRGAALKSCAYSAKCFDADSVSLAADDVALAAVGVAAEARLWQLFATSGMRSPLALSVAAVRGCLQLLLSVTSAAEAAELAAALRAAGFVTAPGAGADAPLAVVPGPLLLHSLLGEQLRASFSHVHVSTGGGRWGATLQREDVGGRPRPGPSAALQLDTDAAVAAEVESMPPLRIDCIEPAAIALLEPASHGVSVFVAAGRPGMFAAPLQPPRSVGSGDDDDPTSSTVSVRLHCSGPLDACRHRVVVTGGAAGGAVKPLRVTLAGAVATLVLPRPAARTVLQLQVVEDLPARLGARVSAAAPLMALPTAAAAELTAAAKAGGAGVADAVRDMAWLLLLLRRQQAPDASPLGAAGAGQLTDACGRVLEALLAGGLFEAAATLLRVADISGIVITGLKSADAAGLRAGMAEAAGDIAAEPAVRRLAGSRDEFLAASDTPAAAHGGLVSDASTLTALGDDGGGMGSHSRGARSASGLEASGSGRALAAAPAVAADRAVAALAAGAAAVGEAAVRHVRRRLALDTAIFSTYLMVLPFALAFATKHRASQALSKARPCAPVRRREPYPSR
jgi:hypothetical protein